MSLMKSLELLTINLRSHCHNNSGCALNETKSSLFFNENICNEKLKFVNFTFKLQKRKNNPSTGNAEYSGAHH